MCFSVDLLNVSLLQYILLCFYHQYLSNGSCLVAIFYYQTGNIIWAEVFLFLLCLEFRKMRHLEPRCFQFADSLTRRQIRSSDARSSNHRSCYKRRHRRRRSMEPVNETCKVALLRLPRFTAPAGCR